MRDYVDILIFLSFVSSTVQSIQGTPHVVFSTRDLNFTHPVLNGTCGTCSYLYRECSQGRTSSWRFDEGQKVCVCRARAHARVAPHAQLPHVAQTQRIALSFVVISREYYCHPMSLSSSKRETPQVALPNDAHSTLQVRPRPTNYDLHFMTEKRGRPEGMFCTKEKGKVLLLLLMNEREVFLSSSLIIGERLGWMPSAEWQALPRPWAPRPWTP